MPSRKRDRSKTPEIRWDALLAADAPVNAAAAVNPQESARASKVSNAIKRVDEEPAKVSRQRETEDPGISGEEARTWERRAWRNLVVRLAALRGDPKVEALLKERHRDLLQTAERCGAGGRQTLTLAEAKETALEWFKRGLRGSNRQGPAQRATLCDQLAATLKDLTASLRGASPARLAEALERALPEEEGPLIAIALGRELEGSRYEGLWISRESPGMYILGDRHEGSGLPNVDAIGANIHPCIRVRVKVTNGKLIVENFFNDGEDEPVPAKVPIGPFLSVYFEGLTLKKALACWSGVGAGGVHPAALPAVSAFGAPAVSSGHSLAGKRVEGAQKTLALDRPPPLPPGWERRESRSKKGVFYYANEAKGTSQLERPTA